MPYLEWEEAVKFGDFIDYDGHGYLSTETEMSDKLILPSDVGNKFKPKWATHVAWFNR